MNPEFNFSIKKIDTSKDGKGDFIRINKNSISAQLSMLKYIDKDTKQHVLFLPAFEISGYGENEEKALEMLKFILNEVNKEIITASQKDRSTFFSRLGWKQAAFKNKEFSKSYIDINGNLQNFNAVDNKVERLTLETTEVE